MIEEDFELLQVDHRLASEERQDESGDSDDDFFLIDPADESSARTPLLTQPATEPQAQAQDGHGDVLVRVISRSKSQAQPESLQSESEKRPIKLLLSSAGNSFSGHQSGSHDTDRGVYGLLSAESPHYLKKAEALADKFEKASGCTKVVASKWDRPDLKILYWFSTGAEYQTMAKSFKEGIMRNILINKDKYRAVALEPVRVIDSSLKAFVTMDFPSAINTDIKHSLKPLFDPVSISRRFIFVPSTSHQELTSVEDTDSSKMPSLVVSMITNVPGTSAARRISDVLNDSESWSKYAIPFDSSSNNLLKNMDVFQHNKYHHFLPLISLTTGQAGWTIDNGIRVTIFCGSNYSEMVEFYSLVLNAKPVQSQDHVIFVLMKAATSLLELVLCDEPSLSVCPIDAISLHFIVDSMVNAVGQLARRFVSCDLDGIENGVWRLRDPYGNKIVIHDRSVIEKLK